MKFEPNQVRPRMFNADRPWDRQPWDDDRAWAAFRAFVRLPMPRTVSGLAEAVGVTVDVARELTKRGKFFPRAHAFDACVGEVYEAELVGTVKELAQSHGARHAELINTATELVCSEFAKHLQTSKEALDVETVSLRDCNAIMANVVKLGRLLDGKATEHHAHVHQEVAADVSRLSLAEAEQLRALLLKSKGQGQ